MTRNLIYITHINTATMSRQAQVSVARNNLVSQFLEAGNRASGLIASQAVLIGRQAARTNNGWKFYRQIQLKLRLFAI